MHLFYSILEEWINYVRHLQSRAKVTDAFQPRPWEAVETIRGDIEFTISCNSPETTSLSDGVTRSVNPAGFFSEQDKWLRQHILYGLLLPVTFNLAPVGCSRLPGAVSHEDTQRSSRWWQDCSVGRAFWWWSSDFWGKQTLSKVADSWRLWQKWTWAAQMLQRLRVVSSSTGLLSAVMFRNNILGIKESSFRLFLVIFTIMLILLQPSTVNGIRKSFF